MAKVTVVLAKCVKYDEVEAQVGQELDIDEKDLVWFQDRKLVKEVKGIKPEDKGTKEPTVAELKARAEELGLTGYEKMKKAELLAFVAEAEAELTKDNAIGQDDEGGEGTGEPSEEE